MTLCGKKPPTMFKETWDLSKKPSVFQVMFGTYLILARYSPNPNLFLLVTFGILETSVGCNVSNVYCDFCLIVINNIMC